MDPVVAYIGAVFGGLLMLFNAWTSWKNSQRGEIQTTKIDAIGKATDGYLSTVTAKFDAAMKRVEILEARLSDQATVIADKDKVIGQVIAGAAVLSGQGEAEGKLGTAPLESIKATVEDTNERVQSLEAIPERRA